MSCASKASFLTDVLRGPVPWLAGVLVLSLAAFQFDFLGGEGWVIAGIALVLLAALAAAVMALVSASRRAALESLATAALDAEPGPRMILSAKGQVLFANQAARSLWSGGNPLLTLEPRCKGSERAEEDLARLRGAAETGAPEVVELPLSVAGGEPEWMRLRVRTIAIGGQRALLWAGEDITARRVIEEVLQRDQEDFSDFFDFLPVGLFSADSEGRIRFVNQRFCEWLGRSAEDLRGKAVTSLLTQPPPLGVEDEQRGEFRFKTASHQPFKAYVSFAPYDDAGETCTRWVVVRDVMPEQEWEQALREAEQRFRWLFNDAPVGVVLLDLDGIIGDCNRAFATMVRRGRRSLMGQPLDDLIAKEDRDEVGTILSKVVMGTVGGAQAEVRMNSERETAASLFISPVGEGQDVSGLVLHFIDTTQQRNLEAQFAQSQKMQAMGQLAGGIAHDFNNLLTAMIGFCDLLLQRHGPGDPSFPDLMQIKQNANRAANLVRQLLAFSRRQPLTPRNLNVTEGLTELSHLLRRLLGETVALKLVHGRDVGTVRVDPGQFDQVIINLAVNARDAMPGGGTLTITSDVRTLKKKEQRGPEVIPPGTYVVLEIKDTGTGIPKENLSRLFEPFFSTKELGSGTGLGLATVYGIVRQTDGFIFVDSTPGEGASFTLYLPRHEAAKKPAKAAAQVSAGGMDQLSLPLAARPSRPSSMEEDLPASDLSGEGVIVLAEDEDAVRVFGARALRNKGYTVLEANNGETALQTLHAAGEVDLLITDMMMPGMDGAELVRRVRGERPHMKLLLISGYSQDVARGEFSDIPDIHFLPKPFSLNQLAGKVKEVLSTS